MILYTPNKNWFRDIRNLSTSWTMLKIMRGTLMIGIFATAICTALYYFQLEPKLSSGIFSLLGIVLSILLVFRTNTAYDRWWEGRQQWGRLVNECRNLAVLLRGTLPDEDTSSKIYFARHISNFCISLRDHLRDGVTLEALDLTEHEKTELSNKLHKPNHISLWLYKRIHTIYKAGTFTESDLLNIKPHQQALLDILGACERIKKTPIPFSYSVYIKLFISLYGWMLPFGLFMDFGFYTIPLVMFILFAMLGLELMAEEIEEPFGLDCNDLPTGTLAETIKKNVFEIMTEEHFKPAQEEAIYQKVF